MEVQSPPGSPIGYVMQSWHPFLPKFTVQNERKEPVLKIVGPFCDCKCCSDVIFEVWCINYNKCNVYFSLFISFGCNYSLPST